MRALLPSPTPFLIAFLTALFAAFVAGQII